MYGETYGSEMGVFLILVLLFYVLFIVVCVGLTLLIWCRIFARAGFHWALGLPLIVPIANIVMPFYLAFAEWPVLRQLKDLQNRPAAPPPQAAANPGL